MKNMNQMFVNIVGVRFGSLLIGWRGMHMDVGGIFKIAVGVGGAAALPLGLLLVVISLSDLKRETSYFTKQSRLVRLDMCGGEFLIATCCKSHMTFLAFIYLLFTTSSSFINF